MDDFPTPSVKFERLLSLQYAEGWQVLLESPDATDYHAWLDQLADMTRRKVPELSEAEIRYRWMLAIEITSDAALPDVLKSGMSQDRLLETGLLTLRENVLSMGWDEDGVAFTVPNLETGEPVKINLHSFGASL